MKKILISSSAAEYSSVLLSLGYDVRILRPSPLLPAPVSDHADMLCFPLKNKILICGYYLDMSTDTFTDIKTVTANEEHSDKYPQDILLNAFIYKNVLYGNISHISHIITDYCTENGIKMCAVKQGYTRCSTLLTPEFAVSADTGIVKAMRKNGVNAFSIRPGNITLPGYDTGFIGGASFYDDGTVYFFGDIKTHPDGDAIVEYCEKYGVKTVCLSAGKLNDKGGAVIIRQNA